MAAGRAGRAEHLDAELVVFAEPPRLRLFIAEDRRDIVDFERQRAGVEAVFNDAADDGGRPLGTQRDRAAALILKGIHFLLDDVGRVADAAQEKLGVFKGGKANFREAEVCGAAAEDAFQILPVVARRRQNVLGAFGNADTGHE